MPTNACCSACEDAARVCDANAADYKRSGAEAPTRESCNAWRDLEISAKFCADRIRSSCRHAQPAASAEDVREACAMVCINEALDLEQREGNHEPRAMSQRGSARAIRALDLSKINAAPQELKPDNSTSLFANGVEQAPAGAAPKRSQLRRIAIQKGEPMPEFAGAMPEEPSGLAWLRDKMKRPPSEGWVILEGEKNTIAYIDALQSKLIASEKYVAVLDELCVERFDEIAALQSRLSAAYAAVRDAKAWLPTVDRWEKKHAATIAAAGEGKP